MDELISRAINTEKPQFDVQEWKQKYPEEYQALLSRRVKADSTGRQKILKVIFKNTPAKIAAAAMIIAGISFFIIRQAPDEQEQQKIEVVKK